MFHGCRIQDHIWIELRLFVVRLFDIVWLFIVRLPGIVVDRLFILCLYDIGRLLIDLLFGIVVDFRIDRAAEGDDRQRTLLQLMRRIPRYYCTLAPTSMYTITQ